MADLVAAIWQQVMRFWTRLKGSEVREESEKIPVSGSSKLLYFNSICLTAFLQVLDFRTSLS